MRLGRSRRTPTRAGQELNASTKKAMLEIASKNEAFTFINPDTVVNSETLKTALEAADRTLVIYFLIDCLHHSHINKSADCCGSSSTLGEIIKAYDDDGVLTGSSSQDTSGGMSDMFVNSSALELAGHDLQRQPSLRE
tara:strand:- start:657 stop:1070 length:414 start_codon:yes stop_codon:yes gene_type:complete